LEGNINDETGILCLFHFIRRLGTGAFAEVKKATEIDTGRQVAIKVSIMKRFFLHIPNAND
jgi:serine/threonine protein kinase